VSRSEVTTGGLALTRAFQQVNTENARIDCADLENALNAKLVEIMYSRTALHERHRYVSPESLQG